MIPNCYAGHFHDWRLLNTTKTGSLHPTPNTHIHTWYCTRCRTIDKTSDPRATTPHTTAQPEERS